MQLFNSRVRATLIGFIAVALWGGLALLTRLTRGLIPEFQLLALTFSLAFLFMWLSWHIRGVRPLYFAKQPLSVWLLGVFGLFGYHLLYFFALARAPAVEAGLLAYLWPLLIVLFSALLPKERLYSLHVIGALTALVGCWLLLAGKNVFSDQYFLGYIAALGCALLWSSYSVLSRLLKSAPTDTVGWFCGATACLAWGCHFLFETSVWSSELVVWAGVLGLGLGPVGVAFLCWDYGVKHGDIQLLGVLSYAAPLISILLLIWAGEGEASIRVLLACVVIVAGALIAALPGMRKPKLVVSRAQ